MAVTDQGCRVRAGDREPGDGEIRPARADIEDRHGGAAVDQALDRALRGPDAARVPIDAREVPKVAAHDLRIGEWSVEELVDVDRPAHAG